MPRRAEKDRCPECGATLPDGFESCQAIFDDVCALEYGQPAFGAVHLLNVDAYALQHSAQRSPRSNAFHLMRLCRLIEQGADPAIGQRPRRDLGKAFEHDYRELPYLPPPISPGALTIADVHGARSPEDHAMRVRRYAQAVWNAWSAHHSWARQRAARATTTL